MTVFKTLKLILISLLHVLIKPVNIIHLNLFTLKNSRPMVLLLNKQVLTSGGKVCFICLITHFTLFTLCFLSILRYVITAKTQVCTYKYLTGMKPNQ